MTINTVEQLAWILVHVVPSAVGFLIVVNIVALVVALRRRR